MVVQGVADPWESEDDEDDEDAAPEKMEDEDEDEAAGTAADVDADDGQPPAKKRRIDSIRTTKNGSRRDFSLKSKKMVLNFFDKVQRELTQANDALPENKRKTPRSVNGRIMSRVREYAKTHVDSGANRIHNMDQVKRFREQLQLAKKSGCKVSCKRVRHGKTRYRLLEASLKGFFEGQRGAFKRVTVGSLQLQAVEFLKDPDTREDSGGKEVVSENYIRKFMKRSRITLKRVVKQTGFTAEELCTRAQKFHSFLYRVAPFADGILNFDEIPCSLAGTLGAVTTLADADDKDVKLRFDPNASKRTATLIAIGCTKNGGTGLGVQDFTEVRVPPIVLLKGEPKQRRVLDEVYDSGALVLWTSKGVITNECMITHVVPHIRKHTSGAGMEFPLIILDSATSHVSAPVLAAFHSQNMLTAVVPPGMTSWLQWVDTHFAANYRSQHLKAYDPFMGKKLTASAKRKLQVRLVVQAVNACQGNIQTAFSTLGYYGPRSAEQVVVRRLPAYKFCVPVLTDADRVKDKAAFEAKLVEARRKGEEAAANAPTVSKVKARPGRRPKVKVTGKHGNLSEMWAKAKPAAVPAAATAPAVPAAAPAAATAP